MSTPAWISALPTGVVKTDLTADAVDGVLTYTEALQLLNDVQTAGAVTASEFSSLQTAAANLNNGLAASDYVASIFTQLVDGSPANANWTAGGPAASASPLGDLAAGSTQTHLAQLVGQWFLGTNLPDPAPPSGPTYSYSTVTAPLYGPTGAAAVNDICQGADGDCEVMTSLILLVDNHPQQLAQMIVANPNGTWGVRFYVNGNEVWETVNDQFPTQGGELVYAHDPNFANTALWTAVIEKAYAQLSATGEIGHPAGVDSFDNINANAAADVMPAMIDASSVTYFNATNADFNADKILYIDAVASGDDVMVETGADAKDTFDASGNMELIGDHAFAVTGYDAATGDFIVRNPWGNSFTGQNWDTTFEVSLSAIAGVQGDFAIDDTGHGGSTMTLISESPQLLANAASAIAGFVKVIDSTGAAPTLYNLQVVGGGALQLNGAANVATSAEKALGQVVVSASDLAKVTLTAASGQPNLLISAYDGKAWSAFANVQLAVSSVGAIQNPVLDTVVAAAGSIAVTSLFKVGGTVNAANAFYEIVVPTGDGVVNLNGATNDFGAQQPGQTIYDVSGSQLSLLTYTAPASGGSVTLQGTVYTGSAWTPFQNIQVNVGVSVATALRDYANGQLESAATIADTAANIFANLDALQSDFSAGDLSSIAVTNTTLQHETLGQARYVADHGLLSIMRGDVAVSEFLARDDFLNAGLSDVLIENSSGTVQVGQVGRRRRVRLQVRHRAGHGLEPRRDGRLPGRWPRPVPDREHRRRDLRRSASPAARPPSTSFAGRPRRMARSSGRATTSAKATTSSCSRTPPAAR